MNFQQIIIFSQFKLKTDILCLEYGLLEISLIKLKLTQYMYKYMCGFGHPCTCVCVIIFSIIDFFFFLNYDTWVDLAKNLVKWSIYHSI